MSGTFPSTPPFSKVTFTSYQPTLVSWSHSLQRQARSRGGAQRWLIEGEYSPLLRRPSLAPIIAFALAQRGQYEIFTLIPPLWSTARGIATGTPLVKGASQTGRNITTDGWTATKTGILLAGDFIKFNGQDKIYMITENADSDGSGNATITIEPALLASPANDEVIITTDVPFSVAFFADSQSFLLHPRNIHELGKLSFVEVF